MNRILKDLISVCIVISTITYMLPVYAIANKEIIYSKMDSNGDIYKSIITTKDGKDVTQNETDKELPIKTKITYKLDGKDIKPEDLAGKSGRVSIKIQYINKSAKNVLINGKSQTIYTPFMVTLGTIINNKNNKNIEVSKAGRILENGEKTIIVGVVFPGLDESLNLSGKLSKIEIPDSIEITMDSKNFEISNILTYATPKVLTKDIDWSELDELFDKVNELQNGINTIENGSKELQKGIKQLDDGVNELKKGTSKVYDGSKEIKKQVLKSINAMENNKEKALDENTLSLIGKQASKQATSSIEKEVDGIKKLAENGAVKEVKKQEDTILNGVMGLIKNKVGSKINELVTGISQGVTKAMETQIGTIEKQAVQVGTNSIDLSGLQKNAKVDNISVSVGNDYKNSDEYKNLDENTKKMVDKIVGNVEKKAGEEATDEAQKQVDKEVLAQSKEIKTIATNAATTAATITSKGLTSGVIKATAEASVKETANQIVSQMANEETKKTISAKLEDIAKQIAGGTAESVAKQVAPSVAEKTAISVAGNVADEVKAEVLKQVKTQMKTLLDEGLTPLTAGIKELDKGTTKLKEGTEALNGGATKLTEGITKFDNEGIRKISNFINHDLQNLISRGKKLEQLAQEYDKFSSDKKRDDIGFVTLVDSIKKDEESN